MSRRRSHLGLTDGPLPTVEHTMRIRQFMVIVVTTSIEADASLRGAGENRHFLARFAPFLEALQHSEEGENEQHRETGRGDDAAQHVEPERNAAVPTARP